MFQVDGEPYFVDYKGFHEEAEYKPASMDPPHCVIDLTVRITHHAVADLVKNDSVRAGCCMAPIIPGE